MGTSVIAMTVRDLFAINKKIYVWLQNSKKRSLNYYPKCLDLSRLYGSNN